MTTPYPSENDPRSQTPPPGSVPPPPPAGPGQQYQQPYQQYPQPYPSPLSAEQDKQYSFWAHLGGILGILPSLIIYLVFKDRSQPSNPVQVRVEAKEALNWQITVLIASVAVWILVSIVSGIAVGIAAATYSYGAYTVAGLVSSLATLVGFVVPLANLIFSIIAAARVNSGRPYRYPVTFRFIK